MHCDRFINQIGDLFDIIFDHIYKQVEVRSERLWELTDLSFDGTVYRVKNRRFANQKKLVIWMDHLPVIRQNKFTPAIDADNTPLFLLDHTDMSIDKRASKGN